jgi:hypothetical protein
MCSGVFHLAGDFIRKCVPGFVMRGLRLGSTAGKSATLHRLEIVISPRIATAEGGRADTQTGVIVRGQSACVLREKQNSFNTFGANSLEEYYSLRHSCKKSRLGPRLGPQGKSRIKRCC